NDTVVDEAFYQGTTDGVSRQLSGASAPSATANDTPDNWCDSQTELEAGGKGTPGQANATGRAPVAATPGHDSGGQTRSIEVPQPGDLVITEVMANPSAVSDTTGEWFEVYVNRDIDLNGLQIGTTPGTTPQTTITDPACRRRTAGTYLVFA